MSRLTRLVVAALWAAWALGGEVLYRELNRADLSHPVLYAIAGWAAVAVSGAVLLVLMTQPQEADPRVRSMLRTLSESLHSIDLVTEPSTALASVDQALEEMLARLVRVLAADVAVIYLLSEDAATLTAHAAYGLDDLPVVGGSVPVGRGVAGRVASTGRPVVANDLRRNDVYTPGLKDKVASMAAVPLAADDSLVGVMAVGSTLRRQFTDSDLRLLRLAADRLAAAVERARLYETQRRAVLAADGARNQFALLASAGEVLAAALGDYNPALHALGRMMVPAHADWFALHLTETGPSTAAMSRSWGPHPGATPKNPSDPRLSPAWEELVREVMAEGRSRLLYDRGDGLSPLPGLLGADGFQSLVVVPVRVRGLSFGVMGMASLPGRRGYRPSDVRTAEALAQRVAAAIERVLLYQEAQDAEQAAVGNASQLRRLMSAAMTVNRPLSESQVLAVAADQARKVMEADLALASAVGVSGKVLRASSPDDRSFRAKAVEEMVARTGRSARGGPDSDPGEHPDFTGAAADLPDRAWLAAPLNDSAGKAVGSIVLAGARRRGFTPEDEAILVSIAQMASAALGNARLYQEVQANGARLSTLMESSPLAIVELGLDGNARWWNRAASELFGWDLPDPARPGGPDLGAQMPAELSRLWYRAVRGQATVGVELSVKPQGEATPLQVSVSTAPMRAADETVTGIMAMIEDVTERKVLEDQFHQAERLDAMGRLAGGVAHDFNNLVSVILGYSEMLLRTEPEDSVKESVEAIARAGRRAAALTSQLLAVGRREVGHPVVIDPGAVVGDMEQMMRSLVGGDVKPRFRLESADARVLIDPTQLERVVLNLVINSRDAMPEGGRLTVGVTTVELDIDQVPSMAKPGRYVEISVADTGAGMDPETAEHCFEPFFTTKDRTKGTGLGLAAVHGVITSAGGHVLVRSRPGRGTTFTLRLPVAAADLHVEDHPDARPARPGTARILLVEDEEELRTLARRTLESHGYSVISASTGSEALAMARRDISDIDLLVTDVIMPGMGGPELARKLAELDGGLPVLFISGYAGDDKLNEGRMPPGADLLAKPFGPEELRRRVEDALDRGELTRRPRPPRPSPRQPALAGRHGSKR